MKTQDREHGLSGNPKPRRTSLERPGDEAFGIEVCPSSKTALASQWGVD